MKFLLFVVAIFFGGGGSHEGMDILPKAEEFGKWFANGGVRVYRPGGGLSGTTLIVGPPVENATTGNVTVSVTVTGNLDEWGGDAIDSHCQDIPYDDQALSFSADLQKQGVDDPSDPDRLGLDERDKSIVRIVVDAEFAELEDGDQEDDDIGSSYGFDENLGWGVREITG